MIGPKVILTGMLFFAVFTGVALILKDQPAIYDKAIAYGAVSLWVVIIGAVITIWEW